MKIPGYNPGVNGLGKTRGKDVKTEVKTEAKKSDAGTGTTSGSVEAATVSVSSQARDIQKSNEIAKSSPDVRSEKVEEIAAKIKSGTYYVKSQEIAGKMLEDVLSE